MEKIDIYDVSRKRTGKTINRGDALADGERLLIVHICLFNSRNEMLIQQRSLKKDKYPGCWDVSAGGFVRSGEEPMDAIIRETREELGLVLPTNMLRYACTEPFSYVLDDFYLSTLELDPASLHLQKDELEQVTWANRDTVMRLLSTGDFVDYPVTLIETMFDSEKLMG